MNKQYFLLGYAVILFIVGGCTPSVKESTSHPSVEGEIEDLKLMASKGRETFEQSVKNESREFATKKDSSVRDVTGKLEHYVLRTDEFMNIIIDSLSNLGSQNLDNKNQVSLYLAEGKVGDSLRFYLGQCLELAKNNSKSTDKRKEIVSMSDNLLTQTSSSENWQQELFGHVNSVGALLLIYGIKIEMFNIVNKSF